MTSSEAAVRNARRDAWAAKFLYHPDADVTGVGADEVLGAFHKHYGRFWNEHVSTFFAQLYAESGLEPKYVELIATSLLALRGWETGVRAHARLALDSGATPAEIRGAILISLGIGGINTAANGLSWVEPVLSEYEEQARRAQD